MKKRLLYFTFLVYINLSYTCEHSFAWNFSLKNLVNNKNEHIPVKDNAIKNALVCKEPEKQKNIIIALFIAHYVDSYMPEGIVYEIKQYLKDDMLKKYAQSYSVSDRLVKSARVGTLITCHNLSHIAYSITTGSNPEVNLDIIKIWNFDTSECIQSFKSHSDVIVSLAEQENTIISGSWDNTVKVWNKETGQCINTFEHSDRVYCVASFDMSSDNQIVSGSNDKTVKLWDIRTDKEISNYNLIQSIHTLAVMPELQECVFQDEDDCLTLYNPFTNQCRYSEKKIRSGASPMMTIDAFAQQITSINSGFVQIWNSQNGKLINEFKKDRNDSAAYGIDFTNGFIIGGGMNLDPYITLYDVYGAEYMKIPYEEGETSITDISTHPKTGTIVSGSFLLSHLDNPEDYFLRIRKPSFNYQEIVRSSLVHFLPILHNN